MSGDFTPDAWRNRAITDLYEPGSTMKGVTAAAALNEHAISLDDRFNCPGFLRLGGRTVHDVYEGPGSFGVLNLAGILRFSSNVGMSQVGLRLGAQRLHRYVDGFGMLQPTGIELPGEVSSWMPTEQRWDKHFTATVAFGQSVNFSALRLTRAYAAIANGGTVMKPMVVKSVAWPKDSPKQGKVEEFAPIAVRRVVSEEAAHTVTRLLKGVVVEGTGKPAKIPGYEVVGKTGSAQKSLPGRGYVAGKFIASFIGYLPASKPRVVILVTIDEPKGTHWGAVAAAPAFREVARQAMWFLQVPPDDPNDRVDGAKPSTWKRRVARR
jgi:cell division protein FtsI/penicillin-binding protein 2